MPRADDLPRCPAVPTSRGADRVTTDYRISLITPLFGGGVEAGAPDSSLPIRGTAIRGQLAFWWRATRGAGYATYDELFVRHGEIWVTTSRASQVEVTVTECKATTAVPCASYQRGKGEKGRLSWDPRFAAPLPYALFPFQGEPPEKGDTAPRTALAMQLLQEAMADGGVGGKTRSGYGRLVTSKGARRLLADKTNAGGWKAMHLATEISGPIQNTKDVPADQAAGNTVELIVASANLKEIAFRYPMAADLARAPQARDKGRGNPGGPGRRAKR